ncbi:MAG: immunity 53 family protein [Candidatus Sulfotelmatobacter sp.]
MSLSELELWYASQCNGDWEHSYGVKIGTLDNPGWRVHIDLQGTAGQDAELERVQLARTDTNWIHYRVEKKAFNIACGPTNLTEAVRIFVRWFESQ